MVYFQKCTKRAAAGTQTGEHTHTHTQCTDPQTAAEMCLDTKQIVKNTAPPHGQIAFESKEEEETIFFIIFIILYASCIPNIPPHTLNICSVDARSP